MAPRKADSITKNRSADGEKIPCKALDILGLRYFSGEILVELKSQKQFIFFKVKLEIMEPDTAIKH